MTPTSVSLNTQDPVLASRQTRKDIFRQLGQKSPLLAVMLGGDADRKKEGLGIKSISVDSFEVIQRDIEIGSLTNYGSIDPGDSDTTAISKTAPTLVRTLYGSLTCYYAAAPMSLLEWIHGGPGAKHPRANLYYDKIVNTMTRGILSEMMGDGATTTGDGLQKWISETATKWGLDTSAAAAYYYRGHVESAAYSDLDEDLVREYIRLCYTGEITETNKYFSDGNPTLGLVDSKTFAKMQKWLSARQHIEMSRTEELAKLGGFYKKGIMIDQVTFFPDTYLDELAATNSKEGEMFILDPDSFEMIFYKGFAFDFVTNPDKAFGDMGNKLPLKDFADVVWGKYMVNIALWNMFCGKPRNNLWAEFTA